MQVVRRDYNDVCSTEYINELTNFYHFQRWFRKAGFVNAALSSHNKMERNYNFEEPKNPMYRKLKLFP